MTDAASSGRMAPLSVGPGPKIVVIEDDPLLLSLLVDLLRDEGYEVFPQRQASEAYALIRSVRPRLVLLDLRLGDGINGGASGWRILDQLILDPLTRNIPVVLATGATDSIEAHRPALLAEHGVRVLLKPYELDELLTVLTEVVGPRRSAHSRLDAPREVDDGLTPRQREIARLIALGCTNREIAKRLVLEQGTVANHVAHILDRLGLSNRAQVAAWATREGLVERIAPLAATHVA